MEGVTEIETSTGAELVSVVDAVIDPEAAVMLVTPGAKLAASPFVPGVLLIVATATDEDDHVTLEVRSCELPSL
jgi:hypothetical protein